MSTAARISLLYIIAGSLWIGISDRVLELVLGQNPATAELAQTAKGWAYIALTGAILYFLLKREFDARQRSENRAVEREARFHDLFANNPLPMWVYDRDTLAFLDVNEAACAHYGYSRAEFLSMRITDIRPPEEIPQLMSFLQQVDTRLHQSGEWRHRTKDGRLIDVEVSSHTLDFAGKPASLVVIQDITERKRSEAERLETEKLRVKLSKESDLHAMRNRFVSMVSHEFRRPLTTMTTSIELLEHYRSRMTDEAAQKHFERIHEQLDETRELLDDFLALMRGEGGQMDFKPVPIELSDLCRKLVEEAKLSAGEEHSIRYITTCDRVMIEGDEKLLRHAIGNLVGNAVKYSPQGGEVRLDLLHTERLEIHVRDQGIGIPAEEQAYIFDPFYRASNVGELSGTGLGLSSTKQAIELHGGALEIARSDATGTEFLITLPINEHVSITGC